MIICTVTKKERIEKHLILDYPYPKWPIPKRTRIRIKWCERLTRNSQWSGQSGATILQVRKLLLDIIYSPPTPAYQTILRKRAEWISGDQLIITCPLQCILNGVDWHIESYLPLWPPPLPCYRSSRLRECNSRNHWKSLGQVVRPSIQTRTDSHGTTANNSTVSTVRVVTHKVNNTVRPDNRNRTEFNERQGVHAQLVRRPCKSPRVEWVPFQCRARR